MGRPSNVVYLDDYRKTKRGPDSVPDFGIVRYGNGVDAAPVFPHLSDEEFWSNTASYPLLPYRNAMVFILKRWSDWGRAPAILLLLRLLQIACSRRKFVNRVQYPYVDVFDFMPRPAKSLPPLYRDIRRPGDFAIDLSALADAGLVRAELTRYPYDDEYVITLFPGKIMMLEPPPPTVHLRRTRKKPVRR